MRYTRLFSLHIALFIVFSLASMPVHADDASVNSCDFTSLEAAVINANTGGGIITFNCSGTINFAYQLPINDNVTINNNGNTVIFNGAPGVRFFFVNASTSLTLNGFTLQNGSVVFGGAIRNNGTLIVTSSTFTNNSASDGGGAIYNAGSLNVSNSTFDNNSATNLGGAISNYGTATITNSTFDNNSADAGGAIFNDSTAIITDSTFTSNLATSEGGAISNYGTVTISNSAFTNNSSGSIGGAIFNFGTVNSTNNILTNNLAPLEGGAISNYATVNSTDTHYGNNTCSGTYNNISGNTVISATGCPGSAPIDLAVSALACNGDTAIVEIFDGDANFSITGTGDSLPISPAAVGLYGLAGPGTWTDVTVTELRGDRQSINLGGIVCPEAIVIPPSDPPPVPPAPVALSPDPNALGCVVTSDIDLMNATDNTYCRILIRHGNVVNYSGAVPDSLIGLGVKLAVDVYRLDGGQSVVDFGGYYRVCLSGQGRLFYLDARGAPRSVVELATESIGGATCGWIPAAGTLVLTD